MEAIGRSLEAIFQQEAKFVRGLEGLCAIREVKVDLALERSEERDVLLPVSIICWQSHRLEKVHQLLDFSILAAALAGT